MNRVNTFLVLAAFWGLSLGAKAQVYNEDNKEGLRIFLRQPSSTAGQINAEKLGLTIADTANWLIDETWVSSVAGITWNNATPKQVISVVCDHKMLAGTLDATKWSEITFLKCEVNGFTQLNLSGCTALTYLECGDNPLTQLDVSTNIALTQLRFWRNSFSQLDLSKNTALTELIFYGTSFAKIDVSSCTALTYLSSTWNRLTELDVSKNTALTELYCNNNRLTALDVSTNTALTILGCDNNQLQKLDLSKNIALTELHCCENQLTSLNLSKNTALTSIYCNNNRLPLSDLYAASERVANQNNKKLGTQNISINANVGEVLFKGTEDKFKGTTTQYSNITKNGTTALPSNYTINNGTIQFDSIGKYSVTMTNAAIVSDTSQPAQVIATITVSYNRISGKIYHQDQTPVKSGVVQLCDDKNEVKDSVSIASNGSYVFSNVANGDYRVRVKGSDSTLRTYYGNTENWGDATVVSIANKKSVDSVDITLIPRLVLPKGTAFISGILEEDTVGKKQKGVGRTIPGEDVSLQMSQGGGWQTVAVALTDANGHFEFSDLPAGTYRFSVDILGMTLLDNKVTPINTGDSVEVLLTMKEIETGIEQLQVTSYKLRVYPNPTTGQLTIVMNNEQLTMNNVEIYSIVGQCVYTSPNPSKRGEHTTPIFFEGEKAPSPLERAGGEVVIDISHLPAGMYFLKVGNQVVKFVKE